jgi:hypothetical protein
MAAMSWPRRHTKRPDLRWRLARSPLPLPSLLDERFVDLPVD